MGRYEAFVDTVILHVRVTACVLVASAVLASPAWSLTYDEVKEKTAALMRIGDFPAALETAEEMVLLADQRWGDNHPQTAAAVLTLAGIQLKLADYSAAERHYRYALEQLEVAFGAGDPRVADALFGLAELYKFEQRKREAWALYRRADQILRDAGHEWRAEAARVQQKIGSFLLGERENEKAREAFEASHATIEAELGAAHPEIVESLNGEAGILYSAGQFDEAAALFRKGLAIREAALGADHPDVGWSLNMLGAVLFTQRKYDEAEAVWRRALNVRERALPAYDRALATQHNNLAALYSSTGQLGAALEQYRKAAAVIATRERGFRQGSRWVTEIDWSTKLTLNRFVSTAWLVAQDQPELNYALAREGFELAQWMDVSSSSRALAQMSARLGSAGSEPSQWVRSAQWAMRTRLEMEADLVRALTASQRNEDHIARLRDGLKRLDQIQVKFGELAGRFRKIGQQAGGEVLGNVLAGQFERAQRLAAPEPADLEDVRGALEADEAMVRYLATDRETFVWVVTHDNLSWHRIEAGSSAIGKRVAALRSHLDPAGDSRSAVSLAKTEVGSFDFAAAHDLYDQIWAPFAQLLQGKSHVLIVPSGPLTGLAFQVLVTDAIDPQSPRPFKEARWLIRDHAISILPFAAALTLLREMPAGSSASEALFGIADPRFEDCADDEPERPAQLAMSDMYRGLSPDPDAGCKLVRLPESRAEVARAAEGAGEGKRELLFGAEASEHQLKARSEDGSLAQYRVLMFATHGHIAGEISGFAEPGLSLSADTAHGEDGYLSASEISDLKLNADWVILSACNTAAGEQPGAEALSGLASSFFFAGARALLVSHWRVYSDAAVTLTTGTFDAIARRPGIRRAEALRQAMLAMIEGSRVADAHPARWAPFVLIGDGR